MLKSNLLPQFYETTTKSLKVYFTQTINRTKIKFKCHLKHFFFIACKNAIHSVAPYVAINISPQYFKITQKWCKSNIRTWNKNTKIKKNQHRVYSNDFFFFFLLFRRSDSLKIWLSLYIPQETENNHPFEVFKDSTMKS